jgi:predicted ATPase
MYIQEIIIDGFKSYAQKTVVSGFDPQFNAITGLNGTGKSNILDSICFVLGISNLTQVRYCGYKCNSDDELCAQLLFIGSCRKFTRVSL